MILNHSAFFTGAVGIEPTSMVLETTVLPLNYAPIGCFAAPTNEIIAWHIKYGKRELSIFVIMKKVIFSHLWNP